VKVGFGGGPVPLCNPFVEDCSKQQFN